jgi:phosphoribosylamine---glycine ligase
MSKPLRYARKSNDAEQTMSKTVLVIGSGGREHALAWRLAQEAEVALVLVAPGNAGTAQEAKVQNRAVAVSDIEGLLRLVETEQVDFTVVGPETPLSLGVVDAFNAKGLAIFGPTKNAAQLESSKAFSKDFLARHQIPTARYQVFTEAQAAINYIRHHGAPIVVKADGLAAGKGVVVAKSVQEAENAVLDMLGGQFGEAGARVIVEEFVDGVEASYIVIASGRDFVPMATSQDHKRVFDGDQGPNTGGMGAYSPAPVVTPEIEALIQRQVIQPTLDGMLAEGAPFCGFLYAGVMISSQGSIKVLEFNTRMGDPETQPILSRLSCSLLAILQAAASGQLAGQSLQWDPRFALGVVLCAEGYPGSVQKGDAIEGLDRQSPNSKVFCAGVKHEKGRFLTDGGRVLCVVGLGETIQAAQAAAYARADQIQWSGRFMRRDIGWRALG